MQTIGNVVIYSQNACPHCTTAKKLLEANGISYTEKNLSASVAYKNELFDLAPGVRSVPQIAIGGKIIGGLEALQKYLAR